MRKNYPSSASRSSDRRGLSVGEKGLTILLVVAFIGVFAIIMGTVTSYVFQQARYGRALFAREQAISIAEAGLEYYKWFLAHNPSILIDGDGLVSPYEYVVSDPEGGALGSAEITATAAKQCGIVQWIDIESKGTSDANPVFPRTLSARYMKPSVAEYAYLYSTNVWFGANNVGYGPYHANNGVRADGWSNSTISASVEELWCDGSSGSLGCDGSGGDPPPGWYDGVFGLSSTTALWRFPVSTVDFAGMALSFSSLEGYAAADGLYLAPTAVYLDGIQQGGSFSSVGGEESLGYHLTFLADGRVEVRRVTGTNANTNYGNTVRSYNSMEGWHYTHVYITSETLQGTYTLPSDCAVIYSEAKTWIDGTVGNKVTLVAADTGSFNPDIILNGDVLYASSDGTVGLTAVAEDSVHIGLLVPDDLSLQGIFVAQSGQYGRDYFYPWYGYVPSAYWSYVTRDNLNTIGTFVSALRGGVCWSSGGTCVSGFQNRFNAYDRILAFSPPPFTPAAGPDFGLQLWREK